VPACPREPPPSREDSKNERDTLNSDKCARRREKSAIFLPGLNNDQIQQIRDALCLPEGTIEFQYRSSQLFDTQIPTRVLIQAISDGVFLKLVRDSELALHFIHSSPNYGTRVATIGLNYFVGSTALRIRLVWSPEMTELGVTDANNKKRSQSGAGIDPNSPLQIATAKNEIGFRRNLQGVLDRLKILTGLTLNKADHPLVHHLISAEQNYRTDRLLGLAEAAYAKLAVEDLDLIRKSRLGLFKHFKKELRRTSVDNYFGLRLEIRIAASLIASNTAFQKTETPDFVLTTLPSTGIECTSAHLELKDTTEPGQVVYRVIGAITQKTRFKYKTARNILAIDLSNLFFHEGHETCNKILADKDKSLPILKKHVNSTIFQSVLYFSHAWKAFEDKGITLQSFHSRIDRDEADPEIARFLDSRFPFGDVWSVGHISKMV
jgi:hypothetical protein